MNELVAPTASDEEIIALAVEQGHVIQTQDLDFSALIALRGMATPSLISLRLRSANVGRVNGILEKGCRPTSVQALSRSPDFRSRTARDHPTE